MSLTFSVILDTRRIKLKTQKYLVKLRVINGRKPKDYTTVYDLTEEEYNKLSVPNIGGPLKDMRDQLRRLERAAEVAAERLEPFTFQAFERDFILDNQEFVQRTAIIAAKIVPYYEFDRSSYENRFPIFPGEEVAGGDYSRGVPLLY